MARSAFIPLLSILTLHLSAVVYSKVIASCVAGTISQCPVELNYYCTNSQGTGFCCSESQTECRGLNSQTPSTVPVPAKKVYGDRCNLPTECISGNCGFLPGQGSGQKYCLSSQEDSGVVTEEFLYDIDPLNPVNSGNSENIIDGIWQDMRFRIFQTPGGVVSLLLFPLFTIAGLIVFVMVIWGGFEMLMSATSSKAQEAGKQRITAAIIGFVLLFISYWLAQIIEMIFGIVIL